MKTLTNISPLAHAEIMQNLEALQAEHGVRILFAIESGSRAWGFPSPDSDYDVRFVYARPRDWYLSIFPGRDVIELPIVGDMDINGWDIKKALGLMLKPNPVLLEWLSSPIRYMWDENVCEDLQALAHRVTFGPSCLHHYLSLGSRQWRLHVVGHDSLKVKKYFYCLRPAMVIRWLRMNPDTVPPMNFFDLRAGIDLDPDLIAVLDEMVAAKRKVKEAGLGPRVPLVDKFIESEFAWATEAVKGISKGHDDLLPEADGLFRKIVK